MSESEDDLCAFPSKDGSLGLPLPDKVFSNLFEDAAWGQLSSDGELTAIAQREVQRVHKVPSLGYASLALNNGENELILGSTSSDNNMPIKSEPASHLLDVVNPATPMSNPVPSVTPLTPLYNPVPSPVQSPPPVVAFALSNWAGPYDFSIQVLTSSQATQKEPQFSDVVQKLYTNQNKAVSLYVITNKPKDTFGDVLLRVTMVYTGSDHLKDPVKVCFNHSHDSTGKLRSALSAYILRLSCDVEEGAVRYMESATGHTSAVLEPLPAPPPGTAATPITIRFTDLGSCAGGINRRDTAVVFTLEKDGAVVGRHVLPVRICTCPKRDKDHDERLATGHNEGKDHQSAIKKRKANDGNVFWVMARGRENFESLSTVGKILEKNSPAGNVSQWEKEMARVNGGVKDEPAKD